MKRKKSVDVDCYFNKVYTFKGNNGWGLPDEVFTGGVWDVEELQTKKAALNRVKEQLNEFDLERWSLHTKKRDPSTVIINQIRYTYEAELITQAWCKFYECLSRNDLIPRFALETCRLKTMHLCEAPGGFISALNHYLRLHHPHVQLEWRANTLNPEYEGNCLNNMIPDDRLIKCTRDKWIFGLDNTGDVTKLYNHLYIGDEILKNGKVALVTADGSVNCMDDPGDQEKITDHLHFCEAITALAILEKGGTFVLKIFTTFEECTICLLYLLNCSFHEVSIFKPITSKSGNSETYVICKNYKGHDHLSPIWQEFTRNYETPSPHSIFQLTDLPSDYLQQIHEISEFFMQNQCYTINANVRNFNQNPSMENKRLNHEISRAFFTRYHIDLINMNERLVPATNINIFNKPFQLFKRPTLAYRLGYHSPRGGVPKMSIQSGRILTQIFYTKFCKRELINSKIITRDQTATTLQSLILQSLAPHCSIFNNNPNESQKDLFMKIATNFHQNRENKDILLINYSFLSNFMVGLLYILASMFTNVYFYKFGLIHMKTPKLEKVGSIKILLDEIGDAYNSLSTVGKFEPDLLGVVEDDYDKYFLRCIWLYNNNLLGVHLR